MKNLFEDGLPVCGDCNNYDDERCKITNEKVEYDGSPKDNCNFKDFEEKKHKYRGNRR